MKIIKENSEKFISLGGIIISIVIIIFALTYEIEPVKNTNEKIAPSLER